MTDTQAKVRQNYWAIAVAAIANFVLEAVWYSAFMQPWLNGTGRTMEWFKSMGVSEWVLHPVALVSAALMAVAISCITQLTGPQTALRGMRSGALLWLGTVLPVFSTEYAYELRPWSLWAINTGFWLLGMILMGAIVGAWKKKQAVLPVLSAA